MSERDEFEAWAKREGYGDQLGEFRELDTFAMDYAWKGFQAARAPQAVPALTWAGLTDKERDGFVDEIVMHGTGFVTPLYAIIEEIEGLLRAKNAAAPQPSPEPKKPAHAHDWRFSLQDHLYKCDCGATRGDYPFGAASFKD